MQITVNGQIIDLADKFTVGALLQQMQLADRRVAVEVNGEIIPRSLAAQTEVRPGDRIEIVHAIGGG